MNHAASPSRPERDALRERQDLLRAEYQDVERRIGRLTDVLASDEGAGVPSIVAKLRTLEQRRAAITSELAALQPVPRLPQPIVQSRLDDWRRLLRASTTQGRAVLQRVIQGHITFTPAETVILTPDRVHLAHPCYEFEAPTRFDKLFSGTAVKLPATTPYSGDVPEMTFIEDADYGALREKAYAGVTANVWRPQRGAQIRTKPEVEKRTTYPCTASSAKLRRRPARKWLGAIRAIVRHSWR